jgi:endoglucanase
MRTNNWISTGLALCLFSACGGEATPEPAHPEGSANKLTADHPGDPAHNLLKQSTFEDGVMLPWNTSFGNGATGSATAKDGKLCLHIEQPGVERWDAQVRHREMVVEKGHKYTLSFKAWASRPTKLTGKVGMSGPPYTDYWTRPIRLTSEPQPFAYEFDMQKDSDPTVEIAFHAGGAMVQGNGPIDVCFDDLVLSDPAFTPPPPVVKAPLPTVRVNQVGYLPNFEKFATVVSDSAAPLAWQLLDATGAKVAEGQTTPYGQDKSAGESVQLVDFGKFTTPGKGYVLDVAGAKSDPFDIDAHIYSQLKLDAFKYFYQTRSGIPIAMPFAGGEQWTRPAGHPNEKATCAPAAALKKAGWYDGGTCSYTLDVHGGWYDAGDHGKYVVNGGISVWTLLDWYERAQFMKGDKTAFADQAGLIPESGNKVPDILDEARWEIDFMLRMQATEGDKAGMVHHKIHDQGWTALATAPHEDKQERFLRPVTTAATLNLAAVAAQAARIYKPFDKAFAAQCLAAAEKAWLAAAKFPSLLAPASDSQDGGGPYDDAHLDDEFYWAASELFVTTGKPEYKKAITASPLSAKPMEDAQQTAMSWAAVDTLGRISLAVVPNSLGAAEIKAQRDLIVGLAESYLKTAQEQGYRVPLGLSKSGTYEWGSNSWVVNNALVMALAYDFNKDKRFRDGAALGMDYLLGRNAMAQSYVTGFGERALQNPHHRFWAHQANPKYPSAPPGILSGGPNSGIQDPYAQASGLAGCAPQKCFVDNIESWSTNEITINWNSPLMWVSAWLDEHGAE